MSADEVQGTVRAYDPATRTGDVLLDDGSVLDLPAGALEASVRRLRRGQRLRLRTAAGRVTAATLLTLPLPEAAPAQERMGA